MNQELNELLSLAIQLAATGHKDQYQADGLPYILHCLRVMMNAKSVEDKIVAILHDSIEDTDITLNLLKEYGFPKDIIHAIDLLTSSDIFTKDSTYSDYIYRISCSSMATRIKLLDLKDNLDLTRLDSLTDYHLARAIKYHKAIKFLEGSQSQYE